MLRLRRAVEARRDACRRESGAVAIISALVSVVLLVVAAFVVDIGGTWARRGQLQVQADEAALYAAAWLPARTDAERNEVAERAAWYLCDNLVLGQDKLSAVPQSCSSPSDPDVQTWAQKLLADGAIDFPSPTEVKVVTPPAQVDFHFGQVAGPTGTVQQKMAIAKVSSPGDIVPVGLSLNCMLTAANSLPLGVGDTLTGVVPLNYMSTGPLRTASPVTTWPAGNTTSPDVTIAAFVPPDDSTAVGTTGGVFTVTGSGWGRTALDLNPDVDVYFRLGNTEYRADTTAVNILNGVGSATFTLPDGVANQAGTWKVKVAVDSALWGGRTWSELDVDFNVTSPAATADLLGCGRTLKSPRDCLDPVQPVSCTDVGNPGNLETNIKEGLDHGLISQVDLVSATVPDSVPDVLSAVDDPNVLFRCQDSAISGNYHDVGANIRAGRTPNCVHLEAGATDQTEFTEGFLGAPQTTPTGEVAGRLVCTQERPCPDNLRSPLPSSQFGLPSGYTINDDRFTDFVKDGSVLTSEMFFTLSTYLTPGIPVVTPDSKLKPELYSSHRFFWVPVMAVPTQSMSPDSPAADHPILTFRPVFVTQSQMSGIPEVDLVLDLVDAGMRSLLGIDGTDDHGIVMDPGTGRLRALRFMTIEPSALPAVPSSWKGPTSEYVGTGPKIIRLVK